MTIEIPEFALVSLIGISGSGKTTFAKKHFSPTEILSSEYFRALVSNDENNQSATKDAFEVLHHIAGIRLRNKLLTIIDAANIQEHARKQNRILAARNHAPDVLIVLNIPSSACLERNANSKSRDSREKVLKKQESQLKKTLSSLPREGFKRIYHLNSEEEVNNVRIVRVPLASNFKHEKGAFDLIGDVHGCFDELEALMTKLGYRIVPSNTQELFDYSVQHPEGRRLIFVGDFTDRGPKSPKVLKLVMSMWKSGIAFCVQGNHDDKLKRKLAGRNVQLKHGLEKTMLQLEKESDAFKDQIKNFIDDLPIYMELDEGKLVVAHAGLKEHYHGRISAKIRSFCLYGDVTGLNDKDGKPERLVWAKDYTGDALVVYGHTAVPEAEWINNTIDIDTGCVFGGKLTALRYPELELVDVPARKTYFDRGTPLTPLLENLTNLK